VVGGFSVKTLVRFLNDEHGAELAEYAVGTAILVAIALIVYTVLGDAVNNKMNRVANEIDE
jgi:Flp pilus assembly pilin Flp